MGFPILDRFAGMTEDQRRAAYANAQQQPIRPDEVRPLTSGIWNPYAPKWDGDSWEVPEGPLLKVPTSPVPGVQPSAQDPRAFFQSLFPGATLTPQQLAAKEQELAAQGIRLLGPNAAGMRTKIELPNGQIVDVIGGAGAGHNRSQWMIDSGGRAPMQAVGQTAGSLGNLLNGGTNYAARLPALEKTPGYQFRFDQGRKMVEGGAAAKGTLLTGGAAKDLAEYGQGLASTEFDNEYRRLFGLAGLGQGAAGQIGQYGSSYANNATDLLTGAGNARAAGAVAGGNAWGGALGNVGQSAMDAYLYSQMLRQPQPVSPMTGSGWM